MQIVAKIAYFGKGLRSIYLPIIYIVLQLAFTHHITRNTEGQLDSYIFYMFFAFFIPGLILLSRLHFESDIKMLVFDGIAIPVGWLVALAVFFIAEKNLSFDGFLTGQWYLFAIGISMLVIFASAIFGGIFTHMYDVRKEIIKVAPSKILRFSVVIALPVLFICAHACCFYYLEKSHILHTDWSVYFNGLKLSIIFLFFYGTMFYSATKRTIIFASAAQPIIWVIAVVYCYCVKYMGHGDLLSLERIGGNFLILGVAANLVVFAIYWAYKSSEQINE